MSVWLDVYGESGGKKNNFSSTFLTGDEIEISSSEVLITNLCLSHVTVMC